MCREWKKRETEKQTSSEGEGKDLHRDRKWERGGGELKGRELGMEGGSGGRGETGESQGEKRGRYSKIRREDE